MTNEEIENKVKLILNRIRPYLQRDGGDVIFDSFIDGIVYVKMVGACEGCSLIDETLSS